MSSVSYVPERGHAVWLQHNPQAGHEQRGHRPALVLSPAEYSDKVGLVLVCPITKITKGYPFEVPIPDQCEVSGVVLADQIKCLDWRARNAQFICVIPADTVETVVDRIKALIEEIRVSAATSGDVSSSLKTPSQ